MTLSELFQLRDRIRLELPGQIRNTEDRLQALDAAIRETADALKEAQRLLRHAENEWRACQKACEQEPKARAQLNTARTAAEGISEELRELESLIHWLSAVAQGIVFLPFTGKLPLDLLRSALADPDLKELLALIQRDGRLQWPVTAAVVKTWIDTLRTTLEQQQLVFEQAEAEVNACEARYLSLRAQCEKAPAAEEALRACQERVHRLEGLAQENQQQWHQTQADLANLRETLVRLPAEYEDALARLIPDLVPGVPVLLLPVRLETRYFKVTNGMELRVRVYPDDIHQDTHETGLTREEIESGRQFWERWWRLGAKTTNESGRLDVWNAVATRFGARRGAWIVRRLSPLNPRDRPRQSLRDDQPLLPPPRFPEVERRDQTWSRPAHTQVLPDRWVALGYRNGRREKIAWGELIPDPLATGPDPDPQAERKPDQGVDEGMLWMVDFDEAEKKGMGLRLTFTPQEESSLDQLLVLGVKATLTPPNATQSLQRLLEAHEYTWGLGFVAAGTPTNNTDDARSGFSAKADLTTTMRLELGERPALADGCDGDLVRRAWGLPASALARVEKADLREQEAASHLQSALWPATWEYYLYNMLPDEKRFPTGVYLEALRAFYATCVRGRGPLPALRVGNQPYGILPATSLARWMPFHAQPEILVLVLEPAKAWPMVAWDLDEHGSTQDWQTQLSWPLPPLSSARSGALCVADVTRTEQLDLLCLLVDWDGAIQAERARLGVGRNLDSRAVPQSGWHWLSGLPDAPEPGVNLGSGLAVADVDQDSEPEIVVLRIQSRSQTGDAYACLTTGDKLGPDADGVGHWEQTVVLSALDRDIRGAGLAVGRLAGSAEAEIIIFHAARKNDENLLFLTIGNQAPVLLQELQALLPSGELLSASFSLAPGAEGYDAFVACVVDDPHGLQIGCVFQGLVLNRSGAVKQWRAVGRRWTPPTKGRLALAVAEISRHDVSGLHERLAGAVNFLTTMKGLWLDAVRHNRVPAIGRGDPDEDLVQVLGSVSVSGQVEVRDMIGREKRRKLAELSGGNINIPFNSQLQDWLGLQGPFIGYGLFDSSSVPGAFVLVQPEVSETKPLGDSDTDNYILWLRNAPPQHIQDRPEFGAQPALLFQLLRASTLWAYADAALRRTSSLPKEHRDPEILSKLDPTQAYPNEPTPWSRLADALSSGQTLSDPPLDEFLGHLDALSTLPTALLERLLAETLDLSAHRLDAWVTGLATQRLWELRQHDAEGIVLGGYGWVEKLAPRPAGLAMSQGYVHAPSLAHATAAAVLRSGYLSHQRRGTGQLLALDLSSRRVRLALQLLEGVREGQPLGALLGYRFERGLHENHPELELDRYVAIFRSLYPLVAGKLMPAEDHAVETIAADNVVDGLALLRYWQTHPGAYCAPSAGSSLPYVGTAEYDAIVAELNSMADITDACSDLIVAESVYQAVQGNHFRAAAGLDALSRGDVPPPELEVIRTPRRGISATHRVMALWNAEPESPWNYQAPRALAEPRLNQWLAKRLGDPDRVKFRVTYWDPQNDTIITSRELSLPHLGLCPLDVLAFPRVAESPQLSDWEQRVADAAHVALPAGVPVSSRVTLSFDRDPVWPRTVLSLPEFLEAVDALREFLGRTRPADMRDLGPSGEVRERGWDEKELANRSRASLDLARECLKAACAALTASTPPVADRLRRVLRHLSGFCVSQAVPTAWGNDEEAVRVLRDQLQAAVNEFQPRVEAVQTKQPEESATDVALRRMDALFGRDFRVLPLIMPGVALDRLASALVRREQAKDAPTAMAFGWLQRMACVREGLARMETALLACEALQGREELIRVAQLPLDETDRWIALPPTGQGLNAGRLSLALLAGDLDMRQAVAGLVVDEWVETVPAAKEITGLSFHYDAPGACAPQSLLLAVNPDPRRRWNLETFEAILLETLDLAKARAADLETLATGGQYLPALCLAFNQKNETISTQFK